MSSQKKRSSNQRSRSRTFGPRKFTGNQHSNKLTNDSLMVTEETVSTIPLAASGKKVKLSYLSANNSTTSNVDTSDDKTQQQEALTR
jgi:hypothetical protein